MQICQEITKLYLRETTGMGLRAPHMPGQNCAADLNLQLRNSQPLSERKHRFQEGSTDRVTKNVKCHRV